MGAGSEAQHLAHSTAGAVILVCDLLRNWGVSGTNNLLASNFATYQPCDDLLTGRKAAASLPSCGSSLG